MLTIPSLLRTYIVTVPGLVLWDILPILAFAQFGDLRARLFDQEWQITSSLSIIEGTARRAFPRHFDIFFVFIIFSSAKPALKLKSPIRHFFFGKTGT